MKKIIYFFLGLFLLWGLCVINRHPVYGDTGWEGAQRIENGIEFDGSISTASTSASTLLFSNGKSRACIIVSNNSPTRISISSANMTASLNISSFTLNVSSYPGSSIQLSQFSGSLWAQSLDVAATSISVGICKTQGP